MYLCNMTHKTFTDYIKKYVFLSSDFVEVCPHCGLTVLEKKVKNNHESLKVNEHLEELK